MPSPDPQVVEQSAQPYAAIARRVTMGEMGEVLPSLNDRVADWLSAQGAAPTGPPFWRYRVIDMAATLLVDVGFPTANLLAADREVETGELPAGRYVVVRHTGHPDSLMQATADLLAWVGAAGLEFDHHPTPTGPSGAVGWRTI